MMDNGEYAQVVAIGLEGAKLGVAVTKEGLKLLAKLTKILWDAYKYRQRTGKIGKKGLLKRDANINFVKIDKQSYRKFRKQARKHGILYTKLPTFSSGDQKFMHIMYHSSAAPRMQSVLDILNNSNAEKMGQMESAEDYMNQSGAAEMSEEELDRELLEKYPKEHRKLQGEISKKKETADTAPERIEIRDALTANEIRQKKAAKDYVSIAFRESDIIKQKRDQIYIKLKNGNQKQYAWIPKEAVFMEYIGKGIHEYTASFHPDYLLPVSSEVDGGTRQISVSALRNQGTPEYARDELRAEIASAFISQTLENREKGKHFSSEKMKRLPSKLSRAR